MTLVDTMRVGAAGVDDEPSTGGHAVARTVPRYRADIDGLRAIAVLAVLLVHSGIAGVSGGFVGVDVFFVISGYLIHRDLAERLAEEKFSALAFYGRRLRRTVPALYVVAGVTMVAAAIVMVPGDLVEAARSLVATLGFVPNLYFWEKTGYFDSEALTKPLLHTWSLGVEAQFYLVAPALALLLHRLAGGARRAALALLFLLAFAAGLALHRAGWSTGFYLAPARLFEFLIGVALAEGVVPAIRRTRTAEIVAALALATIGLCVLLYHRNVPHPGLPTLAPCLLAAAIIHVGGTHATRVGRLLAARPIAFLGLISYSIYLWHWPVLVLARAAGIDQNPLVLAGEAVLVLALSILTWRFVEVPFRTAGSRWRRRLPWLVPASAAVLAAFAGLLVLLQGLPQRFPPDVAAVAAAYDRSYDAAFREGQCFITSRESLADFDRAACLRLDPGKPNVLLLGDSHAAQLYVALRAAWPNVNVLQATASGCKPELESSGPDRCTALMTEMLTRFIPRHRLAAIVLAGLWEEPDVVPLKRTVAALAPDAGRVIVVGPLPRWDMPVATLLARSMLRQNFDDVPRHLFKWVPPLDRRLAAELAPTATYVSPWRILCGGGCRLFAAPAEPIQFDYNHLTPAGAALLLADVRRQHPTLFESDAKAASVKDRP